MNASTPRTANASISSTGVWKKIRSASPSRETRQTNHAAAAPKSTQAASRERGSALAWPASGAPFQHNTAPSSVRKRPGKRVARKRLMRLAHETHEIHERGKNHFSWPFVCFVGHQD